MIILREVFVKAYARWSRLGKTDDRSSIQESTAQLITSVTAFSFTAVEGEQVRAQLTMRASDDTPVRGTVTSDSHRIVLATDRLADYVPAVDFLVDTRGLRVGQKIRGTIFLCTSFGEKEIPVETVLVEGKQEGAREDVKTLEDFSQLCSRDLRAGFRFFTSPAFRSILNGKNRSLRLLYRGMSQNPVTYQDLEEFLVSAGRKEPLRFTVDKQEKSFRELTSAQKDTLYIYKNTWGYVHLDVEVEGDFLEVEKRTITTDDFIGKVYGLEYIVHQDRLGEGRTFGRIRIRSVHQCLTLNVDASSVEIEGKAPDSERRKKITWLLRDYLDLRMHILDYHSWLESSMMNVTELLKEFPKDPDGLLIRAFICYQDEKNADALESLWPFHEGTVALTNGDQEGLYLYLAKQTGLLPPEEMNIVPGLARLQRRRPASYLLLSLLLHEERERMKSSADVMQRMEDCYDAGCASPFLYLDAWNMIEKEEALLRRLSPFTIQVLYFGMKEKRTTEGLLRRAAFLSSNLRHYSRTLYRVLSAGYDQYGGTDLLEAICKLLIKGNPMDPACFPWYAKALEANLRITRLYEYYMETYPGTASDLLPLPVRMYFAYNNTLSDRKKALLYASVVLHRKEDSTSYLNYAGEIRKFTYGALRAGRVGENYSILYQDVFADNHRGENAQPLADVLFAKKLTVSDPDIRAVCVCHRAIAREQMYRVTDGCAWPRIYSEDAEIFLEDDKHRRFATTVDYRIQNLMDEKRMARDLVDAGVRDAGLELYLCRGRASQMDIGPHNLNVYRLAAEESAFTEEYRNLIRSKLLSYYIGHGDDGTLNDFLDSMDIFAYAAADKQNTCVLLIREGRYEEAFQITARYGYEDVPYDLLLRLDSRMILRREFAEDEELLCLTEFVWRGGKYDDIILTYLAAWYRGPVRALTDIWEKLRGFQLDTLQLEEKIFRQCMFVHQVPEQSWKLLQSYLRARGNPELAAQFAAYLAEGFFVGYRQMSGHFFQILENMLAGGDVKSDVCALALLRHYSEMGELTSRQEELAADLLKKMDERGYRFSFYADLPQRIMQAYQVEDKAFVEEQYGADARVVLHYQLTEQGGGEGEWQSEPMKNMYHGIFVREFQLFYGESLTYYLTVTQNGEVTKTDAYRLSLVDADTEGSTKYRLLNRMLEAVDEDDTQKRDAALKQYLWQDAYVNSFLQMV